MKASRKCSISSVVFKEKYKRQPKLAFSDVLLMQLTEGSAMNLCLMLGEKKLDLMAKINSYTGSSL